MIHGAFAALATTAALLLGDQANRRWIGWLPDDPPRPGRKQHHRPIPLAGALLLPALLPWLLASASPWLMAALVLATTTGFVDDRGKEHGRELDWRTKTVALGIAAALAATAIVDPLRAPGHWLLVTAFVFVLTNATNFLDNTDGVAAGLSAVSLFALGAEAAGWAALAFVPWNWPRPRLFLGDSGAYCLGMLVAAHAAAAGTSQFAAIGVQLADFVQVVVARCWLGVPPWVGDRRHLTHMVQNLGLPARAVAPLFVAVATLLALAGRAAAPR